MVPYCAGDSVHVDPHEERLVWMRAEFRDAQQRRYEKRAIALVNTTLAAKLPIRERKPPTGANP
jgi:hypothetical protein